MTDGEAPGEITQLLANWHAGAPGALDALTPLVYDELRKVASAFMRRESGSHTLQPTALVHEAYLRIAQGAGVEWESRSHFYAIAARLMRQVLVDHARKHLTGKRGAGVKTVMLNEAMAFDSSNTSDFLEVNQALERLQALDERKARVVELRYFGGLSLAETATTLNVSMMTVQRDLRFAEAWMASALGAPPAAS